MRKTETDALGVERLILMSPPRCFAGGKLTNQPANSIGNNSAPHNYPPLYNRKIQLAADWN